MLLSNSLVTDVTDISIVEGTTRTVKTDCYDQDGAAFDFTGYSLQTCLVTRSKSTSQESSQYLTTTAENNQLIFTIPASATVDKSDAWYEIRVFKDGAVYSVMLGNIEIVKSKKPDTSFHGV